MWEEGRGGGRNERERREVEVGRASGHANFSILY